MAVNASGWASHREAEFGIVSYDWSNAKKQWAAAKPMDCEERLLRQAEMTKQANPASHIFVYRNVVKALPWFSSVREKLDDPAYSQWFLRFDPAASPYHVPACAAENSSKCSALYHDQGQTPEVPTPEQPHPDGSCTEGVCDCGSQPCGEYLFDHRNGSMLREWLIEKHIGGLTGIGSPSIDGVFMDDFWCSTILCDADPSISHCPCDDPVQGASEVSPYQQVDMGLSDEDIRDLAQAWNKTMSAVERALLDRGAYTWWLMSGQEDANAMPTFLSNATCASQLREACSASSLWQREPRIFGLHVDSTGRRLDQLLQDVAFFLLARGPYAWVGWGQWGMTWPMEAMPAHGELPAQPAGVPRPKILDEDFGEPAQVCRESAPGVFERRWTRATISLDCNLFEATLGDAGTTEETVVV